MSDIQEEQKRLYKRAEENDIKLLQEENEKLNLYIECYKSITDKAIQRIEKAVEYINKLNKISEFEFENDYWMKNLINILKGDNK